MLTMRSILKSKIHMGIVTKADLNYMGSITLPKNLMELTDIWPGELVLVVDNTNGARLWTYAIEGENPYDICMNGAASHLIKRGDQIIVMAFAQTDRMIKPRNIFIDKKNRFVRFFGYNDEIIMNDRRTR
jgi:aspartate 1-decarboxylase